MSVIRSLLFVPGSSPKMLAKAPTVGADALIYDLEDAVAPQVRPKARRLVADALQDPGPTVFVRVNHPDGDDCARDLDAVVGPNVHGVIVPKAESPADVARVDGLLTDLEEQHGLPSGGIVLLPLVESGRGLHFAYDIALASRRVPGLAFSSGEDGDFMADIDAEWAPGAEAMLYPRSKTICETRAAGGSWPVDGVFMQLQEMDAFREDCRLSRRLGFQARMAIHPSQIPVIHEVFTPTADEAARQRGIIAAYERAEREGLGAVQHEGLMVDKANVARAQRILARLPDDATSTEDER